MCSRTTFEDESNSSEASDSAKCGKSIIMLTEVASFQYSGTDMSNHAQGIDDRPEREVAGEGLIKV